jgi:flagellar assembly protein FliH
VPGVIKESAASDAQHFSFTDFEREGEALLARAKAQALDLLRAAKQRGAADAKAAREAAYAEGLAAGRQDGEAQIRQELASEIRQATTEQVQAAVSTLTSALIQVEQNKHRLLALAEQGLLSVAIAIAQRICKHLPDLDPQAAIDNCRQTLDTVGRCGNAELHVHPEDHALVEQWATDFLKQADRLTTVTVVKDETVDRGGCIVRGQEVEIDARIASQLDRITVALLGISESAVDGES